MSNALIINNTSIKQDAEGRYCLNDLHKAAGGEEKNKPLNFLRLESTMELGRELLSSEQLEPIVSKAGRYGGTFVVKPLVYAYAMWISPRFHLKVIEFFDRGANQGVAVHESAAEAVLDDPLAYMEKILGQAKTLKAERDRLAALNQEMAPKAVVFDNCMALRKPWRLRPYPWDMARSTLGLPCRINTTTEPTCSFAAALQLPPARLVLPLVSVCAALCGGRW